ncbi:dihydropyrimidinase [Rubrimonas cliftonensis]|uniref:D-hydantoinase n=1 Tax=Rubrimonas cliftonensis TaxID=89524 RepID=A0A1H3X6D5_9RHOB|nr:dihydropyrimidinase [Rubrimonas cliftonensis]SDZ94969.1 dihydropyrimidinase [Rubrimonas cliftonensis]
MSGALDLAIRGGTVVTASDVFRADVGVREGRIVALAEDLRADDEIDASGLLVMPGGVEAHCHIAQESASGVMTADDYFTGSVSAAFGGNSCIVPFAAQHRGMGVIETLDLYDGRAAPNSVLDYGYHLIVADPTEKVLAEELPAAFARGVTSFKVFVTYELMKIEDRQFLDILTVAKTHGAVTMVHAENNAMIGWMSERLLAAGHAAPRYHAPSHPELAEVEAIHRAICLARLVDTPLVIVHVSTEGGAKLVREARAEGARIFGETCPQYFFLTRDDLDRPGMEGAKFMCSPPVRDVATQEILWRHLQTGTFTLWSSDHAPYRFDASGKLAKGPDASFKQIANGMPGIALRLPLLFSEGVNKGRITLPQFAALSATNAAKLYGLTDKGSIRIGGDADIALWDAGLKRTVTAADQHDAMDYTPFEGMALTGWPVTLLSRGRRIVEGGALVAERGSGRYVARARADMTGIPGTRPPEMDPARNFGAEIMP